MSTLVFEVEGNKDHSGYNEPKPDESAATDNPVVVVQDTSQDHDKN
ncbi:MAG: hypothetical protein WCC99_00785 [Candidatus Sulfotelmatobacter sp.]